MAVRSYQDLVVWQRAMRMAGRVDEMVSAFPAHQKYELASQLRRAATSIPSNIAEGSAKPTLVYINHLRIALGSEAELKTQLTLAADLKLISSEQFTTALADASVIGRMLHRLIRGLKTHLKRKGIRASPDP